MIYGYCRISTPTQSIDRQIRNIKAEYPTASIIQEAYTGTKINRPKWNKLYEEVISQINSEDNQKDITIVFDSVSRMSRNAEEGINTYFELVDKGIKLVFLKEHYIDTDTYLSNTQDKIALIGTDEDEIFKGINNYFRKLAKKQIRIAFEQSEKEVEDLHQRTKEGIETARINGKQIGQRKGACLVVKNKEPIKAIIREYSLRSKLKDADVMTLINKRIYPGRLNKRGEPYGIAPNTYYKYKKEVLAES